MGSEMCIRDRPRAVDDGQQLCQGDIEGFIDDHVLKTVGLLQFGLCLLYTSDAADERSSVDLGGRRIIKKKNNVQRSGRRT